MSILAEDNITITSQKTVGDNAAAYTDAAVEGLVPMTGHAEGSIANFEDLLIKDLVTDINPVQDLSGGNPSPTNICPISGSTEANITRMGKNLCPNTSTSGSGSGITRVVNSDGTITLSNASTALYLVAVGTVTLPAGTYIVSGCPTNSNSLTLQVRETNVNGVTLATDSGSGATFTLSASKTVCACTRIPSGQTISGSLTVKPMIRLSSVTDATYEPYNGTTYNIDWTADAGTVYGGTLDVTTGALTVDKIKISQTWGNFTNSTTLTNYVRRRCDFSTGLYKSSAVATSICNVAPYATGYSSDTLHFYIDTTVTTATRAWVYLPTGTSDSTTIEIVYTLATPLTYQLTPTQIATLNGVNNLWSNTGNVYVDLVAIRDDSEKLEKVSKLASDTAQNFWFTGTGTDTGAHITEVSQEEWNDSTSPNYHKGGNLLARSNGIAVRDGLTDLATFSNTGVAVLQNGNEVASFGSTVRIGESTDSNVVIGDNEVIIKDSNTPLSRFRGEGLDVGLNGRMDLGVNVGIGGEGTLSAWSTLGNLNASISNASAGEQGKTGYFTVSNSAGSDGWYGKTLSINNYFREECNITLHSQRDGILTNFPTLRSQVKAEADIISLDADLIKLSSAGALFSTTEATTATLTINGMSNLSGQTITVTNAGYVPLGIVGTRCNYTSGQTGARNIYLCYLSSSSVGSATITYAVRNLDSAQNKGTIQFYILWVRADAV